MQPAKARGGVPAREKEAQGKQARHSGPVSTRLKVQRLAQAGGRRKTEASPNEPETPSIKIRVPFSNLHSDGDVPQALIVH
jgi:hypothetical protein